MDHVYHWKHGWIPLDHAAALKKAGGNHKLAARYLADAQSSGAGIHSRQDVAKAILTSTDIGKVSDRRSAMNQVAQAASVHDSTDLLPQLARAKAEAEAAQAAYEAHFAGKTFSPLSGADAKQYVPAQQREHFRDYTEFGFQQVNGALRGVEVRGAPAGSLAKDRQRSIPAILAIDKAMIPLKHDVVVYRGITHNPDFGAPPAWARGGLITDRAYLSTTISADQSSYGPFEMELQVPAGTYVAYVAPFSKYRSEQEMLLDRGLIIETFPSSNGNVVKARVLNSEARALRSAAQRASARYRLAQKRGNL